MRAAIYVRVSTERQALGSMIGRDASATEAHYSLQTQEEACRRFVAEKGWTLDPELVFREAYSGAVLDERPQLSLLREAMRKHQFDKLVIYSLDRLSRELNHQGVLFYEAEIHDVEIVSATNDFNNSLEGQILRGVVGGFAGYWRRQIIENTTRGRRAKIENGKHSMRGRMHFGYRWQDNDKTTNRMVFDEDTAHIVHKMFELALAGKSSVMIAWELNELGYATPSKNEDTKWTGSTVKRIIENPVYKGEVVHYRYKWEKNPKTGKRKMIERPRHEWVVLKDIAPAYVTEEQWELAQVRMNENNMPQWKATTLDRGTLFTGPQQVVCAKCGLSFIRHKENRKKKLANGDYSHYEYVFYMHNPEASTSKKCTRHIIRSTKVDDYVWNAVVKHLKSEDLMTLVEGSDEEVQVLETNVTLLEGAVEKQRKVFEKKRRAYENFSAQLEAFDELDEEDELMRAEFYEAMKKSRKELSALKGDLEEAKERLMLQKSSQQDWTEQKKALEVVAKNISTDAPLDVRRMFVDFLGVKVKVNQKGAAPHRWEAVLPNGAVLAYMDAQEQVVVPDSLEISSCRYFTTICNQLLPSLADSWGFSEPESLLSAA